jgi:hypothetical protein
LAFLAFVKLVILFLIPWATKFSGILRFLVLEFIKSHCFVFIGLGNYSACLRAPATSNLFFDRAHRFINFY